MAPLPPHLPPRFGSPLLALTALLLSACTPGGEEPGADELPPAPGAEDALGEDPPPVSAPPGTDLWLAALDGDAGSGLRVGEPRNLTLRPEAYDNQPHFTPDGRWILYTAGDASGRTDIHRLDPASGVREAVTRTPGESEYSPTPLADGGFAVIRVEGDGTQRLWRFGMDGSDPRLLLPNVAPVGYQAWLDGERVALFVLGEPASLQVADRARGAAGMVFQGIGPSLQRIPGRNAVSFVEVDDGESWIRALDGETGLHHRIVRTPDGGSHHAWTPDGVLLMASGRRIVALYPGEEEWTELGPVGPEGVLWSRLTVHPEGTSLVLVGETVPPP
jgi:hypothetical protein